VAEQRLGRHDHERLAELTDHLAAEDEEVLGREIQGDTGRYEGDVREGDTGEI